MTIEEKIKQKAKMGTEIENLLDTDLEEEWQKVAEIQWVRLDDVLKILSGYSIVEKQKLRKLLDKLVVKGLISYVEYKELLGVESTLPACPVKDIKKEVSNKQ